MTSQRRGRTERVSDLLAPLIAERPAPSPESAAGSAPTCERCGWAQDRFNPPGTRYHSGGEPDNHNPAHCVYRALPGGCPACDAGLRVIDQVVYCTDCDLGKAELAAALARKEQEHRDYLAGVRLMLWEFQSGIPERFRNFELGPPLPEGLVQELRQREPKQRPESWLLYGDFGRGKTGAAVGYARQWVFPADPYAWPLRVLFRAMPDLLTELRATYDREQGPSEADVIDMYRHAGLLILDDLGAEQVGRTGWLEDRLYQVVGARHGGLMPTVFTSNLSPAELGERLGQRIFWRILELCGEDHVIEVEGPNLRQSRPPAGRGRSKL